MAAWLIETREGPTVWPASSRQHWIASPIAMPTILAGRIRMCQKIQKAVMGIAVSLTGGTNLWSQSHLGPSGVSRRLLKPPEDRAMSKKAAEHHKNAAEHHTHAARHHTEAAKYHEGAV
jgi:hypothetical protein